MSVDNSELLMLLGAKKKKYGVGIGVQGELGFGGGLYQGDPADLTAIGLSPLPHNDDPTNENYGSYVHTNGSVMLFVPAFCYRIGNSSAPSYSRDRANALEIRDAVEMGMQVGSTDYDWSPADGFVLHRAFIDGGKLKSGFFIDKYLCSKDSTGKYAVSVKNGVPFSLSYNVNNISTLIGYDDGYPNCLLKICMARGEAYACVSAFQWSALSMLSLAQGQATVSTKTCAWFDPSYQTNFPKGNNNNLSDINDSSLSFTAASGTYEGVSLTGSASNIAKTTHTGQVWGITDVNGNLNQPLIGVYISSYSNECRPMAETAKIRDYIAFGQNANFSSPVRGWSGTGTYYFGDATTLAFFRETRDSSRAVCGVVPKAYGCSSQGTTLFGNDRGYYRDMGMLFASGSQYGKNAGIWYRYTLASTYYPRDIKDAGLRIAGYAK